jgi:hypothetical protein
LYLPTDLKHGGIVTRSHCPQRPSTDLAIPETILCTSSIMSSFMKIALPALALTGSVYGMFTRPIRPSSRC